MIIDVMGMKVRLRSDSMRISPGSLPNQLSNPGCVVEHHTEQKQQQTCANQPFRHTASRSPVAPDQTNYL